MADWFLIFAVPLTVFSLAGEGKTWDRGDAFLTLQECQMAAYASVDPRKKFCVNFKGLPFLVGIPVDIRKVE